MVARQRFQFSHNLPDLQTGSDREKEMDVVWHNGGSKEFDVFLQVQLTQCFGYDLPCVGGG